MHLSWKPLFFSCNPAPHHSGVCSFFFSEPVHCHHVDCEIICMQRWSLAPFLLRLPHIVYPCCSVCPFVSRLLPPLPSWLSEASPTTRVGCLQLNTGNDESIRGGVEGGYTLITLRTDALTNPCQPALMPTVWIHTYRSLSLPLSLYCF